MPVIDSYPLTPLQQGMLFHALRSPRAGQDVEQVVVTLQERVDVAAMRAAWQLVVDRHDVLRTSFRWEGLDESVQDVHDTAAVPLEVRDWSSGAGDERERLARFLEEDRRRGFDPALAPLLRITIVEGHRASYVVWTQHHGVVDGLSMRIVLREAMAAYDATRRGDAAAPTPPAMPYREFVEWQRRLDAAASSAYWRDLLAGFTAPTQLPVAGPPPSAVATSRHGSTGAMLLSEVTTTRLRELAVAHDASMSGVVQAAWALLLARYGGEEDVTFGVVRRGRPRGLAGADAAVGLFITNVPMRVAVHADATVADLVRRLRSQWVALREHEQTPLSAIKAAAGIPASVPVFDTILVFDALHPTAWLPAGEDGERRRVELRGQPGFVAAAKAYDGACLWLEMDFDAERMPAWAARAMLGHLAALLEQLAEGLDVPTRALRLGTRAEREHLRRELVETTAGRSDDRCVHDLVEEQARRTPDAVAVRAPGATMTYAELDAGADRLAAHLRAIGVGPGACVGICLERSPAMMVAVLATLKAGGACLPLDASYPAERLAHSLDVARAPVVLAQRATARALPPTDARVVLLDEPWPEAALPVRRELAATPDDACYVLFTSGSTGRPKGVEMPHRALVNLVRWQVARARVGAGDATLQFSPLGFDVSFQEIFSTWCAGGTLVLVSDELRPDAARLLDYVREHEVARLFLPFIALQQLAQAAEDSDALPGSLREVVTAGEQLQCTPQVRRFFERLGDCVLENQYGPTESHVVTAHTLRGAPAEWPALPPIGRPIANARVYVLMPDGEPAPVGIPGELFIAGACLAHGYLHRPELTAERFLPDPFVAGERMYRSGDLGRRLPGGDIEYLGRVDDQVKIRGHRVELGEVEAVLAAHPALRECAVMARESAGGRQLVAWFVPAEGRTLTPSGLRDHVARSLPAYMVPTAYVALAAMPLTPSGKVDRRRLPAPDERSLPLRGATAADAAAPRDVVELRLTVLWERLLGRHGIGRHDDFFDLGGHSLLAVSMFGQIRKAFGRDLPLVTLFEAPTIAQLAERLRARSGDDAWSTLVPLQPMGTRPPLVCVPGGGGILLAYRDLVPHLSSDQPVYGLQPPALAGGIAHFDSIEAMARHYVEALRRVQPHGPYFLQGWCIGGLTALEMAQQLRAAGEEVSMLLVIDTTFPHAKPSPAKRIAHHARRAVRMPVVTGARYLAREIARILGDRLGRDGNGATPATGAAGADGASAAAGRVATAAYVLDAEWSMAARYRPRPYAGHLTLYWPTEKPRESYVDSPASWDAVALGGATHRRIEGSHHSMFLEPLVRGLAKAIEGDLRAARDAVRCPPSEPRAVLGVAVQAGPRTG